jgi:hypothetical protein
MTTCSICNEVLATKSTPALSVAGPADPAAFI